jgi:hypothetical protein
MEAGAGKFPTSFTLPIDLLIRFDLLIQWLADRHQRDVIFDLPECLRIVLIDIKATGFPYRGRNCGIRLATEHDDGSFLIPGLDLLQDGKAVFRVEKTAVQLIVHDDKVGIKVKAVDAELSYRKYPHVYSVESRFQEKFKGLCVNRIVLNDKDQFLCC